jgi:hypothetical protein
MRVLRDPDLASMIEDEALRALVAQRFLEIAQDEPYDPDVYGYFIVLEPGDSVAALEKEVGWPILGSVFNDTRFGDPDFSPCFEFLEEHEQPACYEMVFIINDGGFGIDLFIPKAQGMDPGLIAFCEAYAVPVPPAAKLMDEVRHAP